MSAVTTFATSADLVAELQQQFPQSAERITLRESADHPSVNVPAPDVLNVLAYLRDAHGYDILADLTAVDWAANTSPRFTVVWHLLSTGTAGKKPAGAYVRVAADCASDSEPEMPSACALWAGANWHERETFDMYGIVFTKHPDLRRILMWDGYPHHPLRKEFPLAGIEGELPDPEVTAETKTKVIAAPMAGGPFVASSGEMNLGDAEPSAKDESWNERSQKPHN